jgi:6,7-dimethyl-8-ribityllumazine synthase
MSGHGAPDIDIRTAARDAEAAGEPLRLAVVAASWHKEVMDGLLDGARRRCHPRAGEFRTSGSRGAACAGI